MNCEILHLFKQVVLAILCIEGHSGFSSVPEVLFHENQGLEISLVSGETLEKKI